MRLHNGRTTLFRHINGMDGQFILLENHPSWMPVNDADFNHAAPLPDGLAVHEESFYPFEKIDAFRKKGAEVDFGAFGENIIVGGVDLRSLPVGTVLEIGEAKLKVTQIGKECHSHCNIYKKMQSIAIGCTWS